MWQTRPQLVPGVLKRCAGVYCRYMCLKHELDLVFLVF